MTSTSSWYLPVEAGTALTQGDLIDSCPLIEWDSVAVEGAPADLKTAVRACVADVIVMTQACDLEYGKVQNVLLCPREKLSDYKEEWKQHQESNGQRPTPNSWSKHCNNIRDGYSWNLGLLEAVPGGEPVVVDFHEVYTVPRVFLDSFLVRQDRRRFRLDSPYREHLSQAFARFFMRVGLPNQVTKVW